MTNMDKTIVFIRNQDELSQFDEYAKEHGIEWWGIDWGINKFNTRDYYNGIYLRFENEKQDGFSDSDFYKSTHPFNSYTFLTMDDLCDFDD